MKFVAASYRNLDGPDAQLIFATSFFFIIGRYTNTSSFSGPSRIFSSLYGEPDTLPVPAPSLCGGMVALVSIPVH